MHLLEEDHTTFLESDFEALQDINTSPSFRQERVYFLLFLLFMLFSMHLRERVLALQKSNVSQEYFSISQEHFYIIKRFTASLYNM